MRFAELLAHPGVGEECRLASRFGVMAFHGGSLERETDVIATAIADRSGASLYVVRQPEELRWHLPSNEVDPDASPALASFLDHVDVAIAIHGYGRPDRYTTLLAGGSNRALAERIAATLGAALSFDDLTYDVVDDLERIPIELRGLHPDNPVNRTRHGGVQLELPPRVRGLGPYWDEPSRRMQVRRDGIVPHTAALIDALADVTATWCETPTP